MCVCVCVCVCVYVCVRERERECVCVCIVYCHIQAPHHNQCPRYDTKQSDDEVPVMLELWGIQSIPSLLSLPSPLWPGVVALE